MMATYTQRVQTVLSQGQYERLQQLAEERQQPVSVLIREAIEHTYFEELDRRRRLQALDRLLSLDAPVSDWEEMETEIETGALDE